MFSVSVFAQEDYTFSSSYRTFEEGQSFYILIDKTKIFPSPFLSPNSVAELSTGHSISIVERMDEVIQMNGFRTNWYRVSFFWKGKEQIGFVWGGNIASSVFSSLNFPETLFLYGIGKVEMAPISISLHYNSLICIIVVN